jgi:hypothetical protein
MAAHRALSGRGWAGLRILYPKLIPILTHFVPYCRSRKIASFHLPSSQIAIFTLFYYENLSSTLFRDTKLCTYGKGGPWTP